MGFVEFTYSCASHHAQVVIYLGYRRGNSLSVKGGMSVVNCLAIGASPVLRARTLCALGPGERKASVIDKKGLPIGRPSLLDTFA